MIALWLKDKPAPGDTPREDPSRYDATAWGRREPLPTTQQCPTLNLRIIPWTAR